MSLRHRRDPSQDQLERLHIALNHALSEWWLTSPRQRRIKRKEVQRFERKHYRVSEPFRAVRPVVA